MDRQAEINRKTNETDIEVRLNLDGSGKSRIATGIGFFDHLLQSFCKHGNFDLDVAAKGDLHIDGHHTVEDVGIALGLAFAKAVGDGAGITRFGHAYCPLDEALARSVVDISGRPFLNFECPVSFGRIGEFEGELYEEFVRGFVVNARITAHLTLLAGKNQHHILEAMTKSLARALRMAVAIDSKQTGIPSTKGVL